MVEGEGAGARGGRGAVEGGMLAVMVVVVVVLVEAGAGIEWERGAAAGWVLVLMSALPPVGAGVTVRFAEAEAGG